MERRIETAGSRAAGVREPAVPEQPGRAGAAHYVGICGAAGALSPRADSGHGGVLWLGALSQSGGCEPGHGTGKFRRGRKPGKVAGGGEQRTLLRRLAADGLPSVRVGGNHSRAAAALCSHHRRRAGNYGSGQPWGARGRIEDYRVEHQAAVRAESESLHHAGAEFRVSLLLHAQVLVRVSGQGAGDFSRRIRNPGRTVRNPYPGADPEAGQENSGGDLRARVLGKVDQLSNHD